MSGGVAAAGLVSFSNKVHTTLADAEKALRRVWRMQRGVIAAARLIHNALIACGVSFRTALITVTYRSDVEWKPGHIRALMKHYSTWCRRRGFKFRAVWVIELHESGRPHYHVVFWLPRGVTPPMPDKQGWWPHGMSNCKWATSPVGYIAKYASKGTRGVIPKGARMFGAVGLTPEQRMQAQWCVAPRWLRRMTSPAHGVRRVKRVIKQVFEIKCAKDAAFYRFVGPPPMPDIVQRLWACARSGFSFESPFEFAGFNANGLVLTRRESPKCWSSEGEEFNYKVQV